MRTVAIDLDIANDLQTTLVARDVAARLRLHTRVTLRNVL